MKKIVTWSAEYETVMELPDDASSTDVKDAAASIDIEVPGSTYLVDSWEVTRIENMNADGELSKWEDEGGKVLA